MGKVVLIACTNVGRSIIEALMNAVELRDVELAGVVNLKPETAVEKANYDSYVDLIARYHLNIYYCENVNEEKCVRFIEDCDPDVIIQSGWSQKFKREILEIPHYACIGEHPAPLPKGRGAACVNWAIITGEHEWGDTFFKMEMEYDTGVIYAQNFFSIELYDDVKTVYDKVAQAAVDTIKKYLAGWTRGDLRGIPQDDTQSTHYPRRHPENGEFDFQTESALSIYNQIRGQTRPYPGAFFFRTNSKDEKEKVYVWSARLGEIAEAGEKAMMCADGKYVILRRIQVDGEPEKWAGDEAGFTEG